MRDWYQFIVELDEAIKKAELRTLAEHVERLRAKDAATGTKEKRLGGKKWP